MKPTREQVSNLFNAWKKGGLKALKEAMQVNAMSSPKNASATPPRIQ